MTKDEAKRIITMIADVYGKDKLLSEEIDRIIEIVDMIDEKPDITYPINIPNTITAPYDPFNTITTPYNPFDTRKPYTTWFSSSNNTGVNKP